MGYTSNHTERREEICALFTASFTDSEGAGEGKLIGQLVADIFDTVAEEDLFAFSALDEGRIVATILFTRMSYPEDTRTVFLLSPVVVATDHQGKGIGQDLLRHGLISLQQRGVDVVLTYGDIKFYSKVGFNQISEDDTAAPMPLSYPHGWLGQSLHSTSLEPLKGDANCVTAFRQPDLW